MADSSHQRPGARWELTAPESYVLHYGAYEESGVEAFKLAVKELVVRRALLVEQVETKRFPRRVRVESALKEGPGVLAREPPLTIVLGLYRHLADSHQNGLVPMRSFVRGAQKKFGGELKKYRDPHVVGALARRGLVKKETDPSARISQRKRWFRTDAGAAADETLERWLAIGRSRLRRWVDDDPAQALAYARGAGASILLLNQLHGVELAALSRRVHQHFGSGGEGLAPFVPEDDGTQADSLDAHWPGVDSLGDLDAGAFDFGALDGLGGAFGGFDGGGGGGGDGGGL